ncbi:MAG: tRNA guanosine(34) transglycosylase Tgt [Patescibacteria group bacterium]|mgnify:CR=1 FL=1
MNNFFSVKHVSKNSKARLGEIKTDHGVIKTPAFVVVGTKGTIKSLTPQLVKEVAVQAAFVNTYHLVTHPGAEIIEKAGGIHKYSRLNIPLMSDSGGFQVFSLARTSRDSATQIFQKTNKTEKFTFASSQNKTRNANVRGEENPLLVKISENGVRFRSTFDGALIEFTPEKSMEFQRKIGADINMAFDECTYYPATHEYVEKAMERTHNWLIRCIKARNRNFLAPVGTLPAENGVSQVAKNFVSSPLTIHQSLTTSHQFLYGVIQGGTFKDLRKKSAEFVVSQNTPGVAIGGVSVGESKKEMRKQVRWVSDFLPNDRPVHLLGVGQIDDIIDLVKYGVDTFDCVEPTRLARMGAIYQMGKARYRKFFDGKQKTAKNLVFSLSQQIDINKSIYKNNLEKVDEDCNCYVCQNFTKSYLRHLFKQREILGYTLATYHNLWVMERLFDEIRELISKDLI